MKRVYIIHGWDGDPQEGWFPWLKRELNQKGYSVDVLSMPDPQRPKIETWIQFLANAVGVHDQDTYFVGHSIGVQTILRYVETIDTAIGGIVAVAGWFVLTPEATPTESEMETAGPWLGTGMDLEKIKRNVPEITAIFSDDDPYVSQENCELFKKNLGAKIVLVHKRGHLGGEHNVDKLPEVLHELLLISNK